LFFLNPERLFKEGLTTPAIATGIAVWWITEVIPIAVVLVLFY